MRINIVFGLVSLLSCFLAQGQVIVSHFPAIEQLSDPIKAYKAATQFSQNLYNGRIYFLYDHRSEEHQFFNDREWNYGSVGFDGQRFDSVQLKLDVYKQELLVHHLNGDHMILQPEKVMDFIMAGHHFKRLVSGKDIDEKMPTGFYDIVYNGKSQLLVFRKKDRQEKIEDRKIIALYPIKDSYYIYHNGVFKQVRSKKSVLALFPRNERSLKRSLRAKQFSYRKNREEGILTMVQQFDQNNL